jgi:hypothetical protein
MYHGCGVRRRDAIIDDSIGAIEEVSILPQY